MLIVPRIIVAHISVIMAAQERDGRADLRIQCGSGAEIKHISAQLVKNRRDCTKKTDKTHCKQ